MRGITPRGFALPTVLITSVTMMILLLASLNSISSINVAVTNQYYDKLVKEASESGLQMAKACLRQNRTVTWSDASPLRPNTDCNGGNACNASDGTANCYIAKSTNLRTTFSVGSATLRPDGITFAVNSVGKVDRLRSSNQTVWNSQSFTTNLIYKVAVKPLLGSGAGWKDSTYSGHNGYLLTANGRIYGWGANGGNQLSTQSNSMFTNPIEIAMPPGYSYVKSITGSGQGASIICGIFASATNGQRDVVFCRGAGLADTTEDGGNSKLDGSAGNGWTKFNTPINNTPIQVSVSGYARDAVCVLTQSGSNNGGPIYCAGSNRYGMFGQGASTPTDVDLSSPVQYAGSGDTTLFTKVFVQDDNVCAIGTSARYAYCAGDNRYGQLGRNNTSTVYNVERVFDSSGASLQNVYDIKMPYHSGGSRAIYFSTSDNGVAMTGSNVYGTANDNSATSTNYLRARYLTSYTYGNMLVVGKDATLASSLCVATRLKDVSSGASATVGPPDMYCMGDRTYGQIARTTCTEDSPLRTLGLVTFDPTTQGYNPPDGTAAFSFEHDQGYHMASLTVIGTDGGAYSAGSNQYGKLGTGAAMGSMCNSSLRKVQLPAGVKAISIANADEYTMYILGSDFNVYASGRNSQGQLGNGTTNDSNVPVRVNLPAEKQIVY